MTKKFFCFWLAITWFAAFSAQAQDCVLQAMTDFGIDINQTSDPELIKDILKKDMFLDEVPEILEVLASKLNQSQSMTPMLLEIRKGILEKHPAVVDFLCNAHQRGFLVKFDAVRFLNHLFIFEDITKAMIKDHKVMAAVQDSFLKRRQSYEIRDDLVGSIVDILKAGGGLFGSAKTVTMDSVMRMYREIRERGSITEDEITSRINGLKLNIAEATATDRFHRKKSNVNAGLALMAIPPQTLRVVGEDRRIQYVYDQDWTSLYHTWNFAFILNNLDYPELLFHKLITPTVMCADSNDYLFNRAVALWTTINFYLFAKLEKRESAVILNRSEIADLWGSINYQYANTYIEQRKHETLSAILVNAKMTVKNFLGL